ncbi:MAG: hypothetical protein DI585_00470 [Pseudomonas fluorescens]|nr:MAG: hypothetical protein DI585_00470 [Pseudomonas fluorescens]
MGERDNLNVLPILEGEILPPELDTDTTVIVIVAGDSHPHALHMMAIMERIGLFDVRPQGIDIVLEAPVIPPVPPEPLLLRDIAAPPLREQEQQWAQDRFGRPHRSRSRRRK